MKYLPCKELTKVLLPAYTKCCILTTNCSELKNDVKEGHIPRGFCGAFGGLADVQLVLVLAEPGNPNPDGRHGYEMKTPPRRLLECNVVGVFETIKENKAKRNFHGNIEFILEQCWLGESLEEKFKRTWITESVLCSAAKTCGPIRPIVEQACVEGFLRKQLALLPNAYVVALGRKAEKRMEAASLPRHNYASHPGGREGIRKRALESWERLGKEFRKHLRKNG